jgi:RNA polymerase subunit RPABC4/transcription elongation factor Spt4
VDIIPWPGGDWQATARLVGTLIGGYLLVLWFTSVLWVYRDIRSRSRDPITQGIGVGIAVVFPIVGLPVYMVLRPDETLQEAYDRQLEQEAILSDLHSISACPNCRRPMSDDFMVCAYCATPLKHPCTACGQLLQFSWRVCPYCATPRPRPERPPVTEPVLDFDEPEPMNLRPPRSSQSSEETPSAMEQARAQRAAERAERAERTARLEARSAEAIEEPAPVRPRPLTRRREDTDR